MFKVGDKVRVIQNTSGGHDVGTVGTIDYIDSSCSSPQYLVKSNEQKWWHHGDNLKLVKNFTPADLKSGMVVTRRNGDRALFLTDVCNCWDNPNVFINLSGGGYMRQTDYNNEFKECSGGDNDYNIMKVEKPKYIGNIIMDEIDYETQILWQREDPKTLKLKEDIKAAELKIREARLNLKTLQDQLNGC